MGAHVSSLPRTSVLPQVFIILWLLVCCWLPLSTGPVSSFYRSGHSCVTKVTAEDFKLGQMEGKHPPPHSRHKRVSPLFLKPLGIDSLCATLPLPFWVSSIHASFLFLLRSRWLGPAVLRPVVTHTQRKPRRKTAEWREFTGNWRLIFDLRNLHFKYVLNMGVIFNVCFLKAAPALKRRI